MRSSLRVFVTVLLLVVGVLLAVGVFLYDDVPKELTACNDVYNTQAQNHISQINTGGLSKEESCLLWREDLKSLETCYSNVAASRKFPSFLIRILGKTDSMKELYEKTCGEYPLD
jgi:hypothetical protein